MGSQVANTSSTNNQREFLSAGVAASAVVTAVSDAVASVAAEIASVTSAEASTLLADGAIEAVLGSVSLVTTILVEQTANHTDTTSADFDRSAFTAGQKLTHSFPMARCLRVS